MPNQTNETKSNNAIARALRTFAWATIITGFILGIVMAFVEVPKEIFDHYYTVTEWSFSIALTYWSDSFVAGLVFLGFAEIITLLQKIVDNGSKTVILPTTIDNNPSPEQFSDLPQL